ncbi:MAG: hypothetical protein AB8G18_06380 [Gammaproteobacteria bacterium]
MKMIKKALLLSVLMAGSTATTFATGYILDFSGSTTGGTFNGSMILDYSVVDSDADASRGLYNGIVTQLDLMVDGISYTSNNSVVNFGAVNNDTLVGDYFGIGVDVVDSNGNNDLFAIQFQNQDGSALNSDALPTVFDLTSFDGFDLANSNSTGVFLPIFALNGIDEFFALESAQLKAVPLPAGLLLMLSAVATLFGFRSKEA